MDQQFKIKSNISAFRSMEFTCYLYRQCDMLANKNLIILSTTIYLVRHGESEANERNAFLGHCDLNITEVGHKQARAVADFFETEIGCPDVIYSSDLARAYNTAKYTAENFIYLF